MQTQIRRARSVGTPDGSIRSTPPAIQSNPYSGHKPYMKKLDPPTFSGKVEEWPEFRSVWKDLMSDLPDSIQIQHFKANIPAGDQKRAFAIKTMKDMWTRLEKVYGDTDLNIITVKSNLETFNPKSIQDFRRIMEVFEAIETAVNQLKNLNALQYLRDDFGLMNKLILKLPLSSQTLYTLHNCSSC